MHGTAETAREELSTTTRRRRARDAEQRLYLVAIADDVAKAYALPREGSVLVGRGDDVDVSIDHASVSRRHAALRFGASITIEDLGSSNGTHVGVTRLAPRAPAVMSVGEPIAVGSVLLVLQQPPATGSQTAGDHHGSLTLVPGAMAHVDQIVTRIARGSISVLINGETGVGKEVLAERLHHLSARAAHPFLRLNCAALSEPLLESELFGHERGAFTGAARAKVGLLESANGGTVFLDEIGELPLTIQVKLLRVLEERKVLPVGALVPRSIDVRFLAATNRDLEREIDRGAFRRDLLFRINGVTVTVPPLRERRPEVEPLATAFVRGAAARDGRDHAPVLGADVLALLRDYPWPGNIRELRNVIERAVLLCLEDEIRPEHLPPELLRRPAITAPPPAAPAPAPSPRAHRPPVHDRDAVVDALARAGGNQSAAARLLGVSRRTLINRLIRHKIARPRARS